MLILFLASLLCVVIMLRLKFVCNEKKPPKTKSNILTVNDKLIENSEKIISEVANSDIDVDTIRNIEKEIICVKQDTNKETNNIEDADLIEIVQKSTTSTKYEALVIPEKEEMNSKKIAIEKLLSILSVINVSERAIDNNKEDIVFGQNIILKTHEEREKKIESLSDGKKEEDCNETVEIVLEQTEQSVCNYSPIKILNRNSEIKHNQGLRRIDVDSVTFDFNRSVSNYLEGIEIESREKLIYLEPRTNISRFKKSEKEYSEKIISIAKHHTELDEYSTEFRYFLHYDISGDLRAIDTLYDDDGGITDGYAVWLNLLQHGKLYYPCSSTFAIVLLHQIVNKLVIEDADWAIVIMASIWNRYYPDFQHKEILMWIKDYWLTYKNQLSYKEFKSLFKYNIIFQGDTISEGINIVDMSNLETGCMLDFFNENADYRIKKGRTVEEGYGTLLEECLLNVVKRLRTVFEEEGKRLEDYFNISEIESYEKKRDVFRRAILTKYSHKSIQEMNRHCIVSDNEKYRIIDESGMTKIIFTRKRYTYDKSRLFIENIGKITELHLRNWIGISAKFIVSIDDLSNLFDLENDDKFKNSFSSRMENSIEEAVEEVCKKNNIPKSSISKDTIDHLLSNKKANIPDALNDKVFTIDVEKLDKIRNDAENVTEKLIVDETNIFIDNITEGETVILDQKVLDIDDRTASQDNEWTEFWNSLTQEEKDLLSILIEDKVVEIDLRIATLLKSCGILLEVLIEAINEKSIEIVGDTILEYNSETPRIYEDYIDEISNLLYKQSDERGKN